MDEQAPPMERIQVLTPEQLAALNQAKERHRVVMIRMDNEQYLRDHQDVNKVMRALMRGILRDRPVNPSTYAYRFFSRSLEAIRRDLDAKE